MMKLFLSIIAVLTSVIIVSCSTGKSILSENDKLLLEKITGTWQAKNRGTIKINYDGTFTDTILTPLPFIENTYVVNLILSGKYRIEDGNLHFYETNIEYSRDAINKPENNFVYIFDPRRISFEDNFMMMQEFRMFHSDSQNFNSLVTNWYQESWACVYENIQGQKFKCGKLTERFIFHEDSICIYERKYLFETSFKNESITRPYYFNDPHLEIDSLENALVVFHENKMVWFRSDPVFYEKQEKGN